MAHYQPSTRRRHPEYSSYCSYECTLRPVERVLRHFLWDPGPVIVTKSRKKSKAESTRTLSNFDF